MSRQVLSRRTILQGALAATVTAFSPACRSWVARSEPGAVNVPPLDGQLLMDRISLEQAASDFGHVHSVQRRPWAVLKPVSVKDIEKMVRFARDQRLKIAASRGLGESHSYYGQSQVEGGVVIDMQTLKAISEINTQDRSVWVEAGARWSEVLEKTLPLGMSPPTLTDYVGLSVGGTLSVGGIGGQTFRSGLQVDNVLELDVVTGRGELVRCSPSHQKQLFDAVRGGLGQCGIIVRARLRLMEVPQFVRVYSAHYEFKDLALFVKDQKQLIKEGLFDYVEGSVEEGPKGSWYFELTTVKYFARGHEPDDGKLLAALSSRASIQPPKEDGYKKFAMRLLGAWSSDELKRAHPWIDLFVPEEAVESFVQEELQKVLASPIDELGDKPDGGITGRGIILLYAFHPARIHAPFARVPNSETAFLFSVLRSFDSKKQDKVEQLIAKNKAIYKHLTSVGGKRYGAGSIPMSTADWREHFSPVWEQFEQAKRLFDPDNILTPGQKIFLSQAQ